MTQKADLKALTNTPHDELIYWLGSKLLNFTKAFSIAFKNNNIVSTKVERNVEIYGNMIPQS